MSPNGNSDSRPNTPAGRATGPADASTAGGSAAEAGGVLQQAFVDRLSPAQVGWWGRAAFFGALGFLALAYAAYFLTFRGQGCCDQAAWGQFGDFIGGVANPVLGLFTLLGLAFTVWLQMRQVEMGRTQLRLAHEQLELSRTELELTRRELERSATAQHEAAEAMKGQLEQTRLTAQAQTMAADHQLTTAKAMQQQAEFANITARVQVIRGVLDSTGGLLADPTNEFLAALAQVDGNVQGHTGASGVKDLRRGLVAELLQLMRQVNAS